MTALTVIPLMLSLLGSPAHADTSISVLKKGKKTVLEHTFGDDAVDGATHLVAAGAWTWTAVLYVAEYDGRTESCVDVQRLHVRKGRQEIGRPCVAMNGKETPRAEARTTGGRYDMVLIVNRPPESP